jgi:hypothetical protein
MDMTTETAAPLTVETGRPRPGRFVAAFVLGLAITLGLAVGAAVAFDRFFEGRVLPGVRVGVADLLGLSP